MFAASVIVPFMRALAAPPASRRRRNSDRDGPAADAVRLGFGLVLAKP